MRRKRTKQSRLFRFRSIKYTKYGFNVYQLDAEDDQWKEKIIERAEQIRKREFV